MERLAPLLSLPMIAEVGRQLCKEMGYERIGDIRDQEGFKKKVLAKQIDTEETMSTFISDRSTIDCWVLWQRWNICKAMSHDTEKYYNPCVEQSKKYTHIVYVPPMFPPPDDGFRWTDGDYQKQIDRLVRMTLYEWDLLSRTYVVQSSDVDKRVSEVKDWLQAAKVKVFQ